MAPNSIGPTGLTTATATELQNQLTANYESIYGADINVASDTPDGQTIGNFVQEVVDVEDLIAQTNAQFDPDQAVGVLLDQRCAINGVIRQAGTHTITPITVVNSASVNLYGLDQTAQQIYTVSDNAGNLFQLQTTQLGVAAGTHVFNFQAVDPGAVLTVPNTITTQSTIVLGVTSVNNPTVAISTGIAEESDATLRVRRQQSVSKSSQGYYASLLANLKNIPGVTTAQVYENRTGTTSDSGIPGHSIWVVVGGSASASDIANVIYAQRNAGCGMFGDITFVITQVDGTMETIMWSDVIEQPLFIFFTATSIDGVNSPNIAAITSGLPTSYSQQVYSEVNINGLATAVQAIDPNTLVTNAGFTSGQTQILGLSGVAASGGFKINYNGVASSTINWNDSISTIQSKVQAVTGLASALVTGSIASQTLHFNLTGITNILSLITVSSNTLETVGSAAISFTYNEGLSNTLLPISQEYQFTIPSSNIVITPIVINPSVLTIGPTGTQQFTATGGYGALTFALTTNGSSGSCSSSGAYTAGGSTNTTDVVTATDLLGNSSTVTITVT